MSGSIKVSELGKCYAKADGGHYRLFKVDGLWAIYLVSKEMIWNEAGTDYTLGKTLEATFGGYVSDPDNFDIGVDALKEEAYYLMKDFEAEFGL
jgi:hypothetical protein